MLYVMSYHAMSCHVMTEHDMTEHVMSCLACIFEWACVAIVSNKDKGNQVALVSQTLQQQNRVLANSGHDIAGMDLS